MGVAALVLGIIAIILAFFGGIGGVILGIAAVVLGVLGRRAAERDGLPQGSATAGLVTGIIGIVLGGAIFAACVKCASGCAEVARGIARLGEARATIEEIARRQIAYYDAEHVDADGNLLPRQFVTAGPVPAKVPCQDKPVVVTPEQWKAAGWDTIQFTPAGPVMFQFETVAKGSGKAARLEIIARTDPRCDGITANVRQLVAIDEQGRPFLVPSAFDGPGMRRRGRRGPGLGGPGARIPGAPPGEPGEGDEPPPPPPGARPLAPGAQVPGAPPAVPGAPSAVPGAPPAAPGAPPAAPGAPHAAPGAPPVKGAPQARPAPAR